MLLRGNRSTEPLGSLASEPTPKVMQDPRDALKVGFLGDRLSPRSDVFLAQIVFSRGLDLGASRHQPHRGFQGRNAAHCRKDT